MPNLIPLPSNLEHNNGFTLIELVVALALLMIIFGMGTFVSMDLYRAHIFNAEKITLITLLQKARGQSQHHIFSVSHGIAVKEHAYILFTGLSYALRDTAYDISFPSTNSIQKEGSAEIVFSPLISHGATSASITLHEGARSTTISVNAEGRINED
jgi:prepilin-type N-terminal cleavage/methylation domain-containing protein